MFSGNFYHRLNILQYDMNKFYDKLFANSEIWLKNLYNELTSKQYFSEETSLVYENNKAWIQSILDYQAIFIQTTTNDVEYNFFFLITKLSKNKLEALCFEYFKEWDVNPESIESQDLILNANTKYHKYTDYYKNNNNYYGDKPTIKVLEQYLKEFGINEIINHYKLYKHLFFSITNTRSVIKNAFLKMNTVISDDLFKPDDKSHETTAYEIDDFFSSIKPIVQILNIINIIVNKSEHNKNEINQRIELMENNLIQEISELFTDIDNAVNVAYQLAKKKKAVTKKSSVKFLDYRGWVVKLNDKYDGLCVENTNHSLEPFYIYIINKENENESIKCYKIHQDWYENILDNPKEGIIQHLSSIYALFTDNIKGREFSQIKRPNIQYFKDHVEEIISGQIEIPLLFSYELENEQNKNKKYKYETYSISKSNDIYKKYNVILNIDTNTITNLSKVIHACETVASVAEKRYNRG